MKKVKLIFCIFILLIACQQCFAAICVNTNKLPEFSAGILFHSYELAFEKENFSDYRFFSVNSDAEFVNQLQKVTPNDCQIILGLITSHRCLIAGPILRKNNAIGLSTTCSHEDVENFFPYLYSAHPPISKQIDKIIKNLAKTPGFGKIFVIHQPTEVYSEAQFNQFKKKFIGQFVDMPVDMDSRCDFAKFKYGDNGDKTLIFFTYPLPSVKILIKMSDDNLLTNHTTILGNASWVGSFIILEALKKNLQAVKEVYAVDILDWNKVKESTFVKNFKIKYKRSPLDVEILDYDITRFAIKCYKQSFINNEFQVRKFRYCLTHVKYHGISGDFSFDNNSSFADRPLHLTNISNRM